MKRKVYLGVLLAFLAVVCIGMVCIFLRSRGTDAVGTVARNTVTEENASLKAEESGDRMTEDADGSYEGFTEDSIKSSIAGSIEDGIKDSINDSVNSNIEVSAWDGINGAESESGIESSEALDTKGAAGTTEAKPENGAEEETVSKESAESGKKQESTQNTASKENTGTSESSTSGVHTCNYQNVTVTKAATCTTDGEKLCKCSCGKSKTEIVKATGHKMTTQTKEATCKEAGYEKTLCSSCGYVESEKTLAVTDHTYVTENQQATCTADGYEKVSCSDCGMVKSEKTVAATGHICGGFSYYFGAAPESCTSGSEGYDVCSVCGEKYNLHETEPLGHDLEQVGYVAGNCNTPSYWHLDCKRCGFRIQEFVQGETDPNNHDFITVNDTKWDEENGGYIPYQYVHCWRCGLVKE